MSIVITTEQVKELRDATGISVMQCRKALEEAGGDMKKALAILKKTSSDIALKKMSREVKDGSVTVKSVPDKAVLVSLLCETDFVAKNSDFIAVLNNLADMVLSKGAETAKKEAKELIDPLIQKTGENVQVGIVEEVKGDTLGSYVHGGKIAVIVSLTGGNKDLARDVAMHIAAMKPEYITDSEISDETKKTMTEVFEKEIASVNKPNEIKKKMLEGKLSTYFKEKTLLNQPFIKNATGDASETVGKLLEKNKATIKEVKRYSI